MTGTDSQASQAQGLKTLGERYKQIDKVIDTDSGESQSKNSWNDLGAPLVSPNGSKYGPPSYHDPRIILQSMREQQQIAIGRHDIKLGCRFCGSKKLRSFLSFGYVPLAGIFCKDEEACKKELKYPLDILVCEECWLVQCSAVVSS